MILFKNILLTLGDMDLSSPGARQAIHLVRTTKARLKIIDVLPDQRIRLSSKYASIGKIMAVERKKEIEKSLARTAPDIKADIEVLTGKEVVEIVRYVQKHKCDLVVKSITGESSITSVLFGSNDFQLLRKCPCPVWLVKPEKEKETRKIMAAVELEPLEDIDHGGMLNRRIIEIASSLAYRENSELHIVNAWLVFEGGRLAQKISQKYREDIAEWVRDQKDQILEAQANFRQMFEHYLQKQNMADLKYFYHFVEGVAEEVIIDLAEEREIDLAVMGTVGRTNLAGVLVGNTSEAVLNKIDCSVLALKPPGFVSPVVSDSR